MSFCILCNWTAHGWNWEGILVVVIAIFVAVAVFFFRLLLPPDEAGYVGSGSRPPWVRIYCPHVVDGLIS